MAIAASEIDRHVGQRIRQRREFLGISQGRLASHLELTFSQVQKYEKGTNRIGAGRLYLAAEILGVPVSYFFQDLPRLAGSKISEDDLEELKSLLPLFDEALLQIKDPATRQCLMALVATLAASPARVEPPRKCAS
jgi:transcriptional regulator with XRE-family HTH domain